MEQYGLYTYNFDIKISGNMVSMRKYDNSQIKNALKPDHDKKRMKETKIKEKKNIFIDYRRWINKGKKLKSAKMMYKTFLKNLDHKTTVLQKIKEYQRKERFYRSNARAKTKIIDIIACNHKKIKKHNGKLPKTTKFLTLTFADLELASDIKKANAELTKFMKRLSYQMYGVRKNVIKYIAIPETHSTGPVENESILVKNSYFKKVVYTNKKIDLLGGKQFLIKKKPSRWHFHLVLFNADFIKQDILQNIWANGIIDIRALYGTASKVAKYVGKYLGKTHKKIDDKMTFGGHTDKAHTYEKYKRLGLENMKRYSCSRGLKRPKEYSIDLSQEEYKTIWDMVFNAKFLTESCNKINDLKETEKFKMIDKETGELQYEVYKNNKVNCKKIHGTERGSITYIDFELKQKELKAFIDYFRKLTFLKIDKKKIKDISIIKLFNFVYDFEWERFVNKLQKAS